MLASLTIHNILLFRNQHIQFGEGLNVVTGETGAGKSMLLDCLGFVLGERKSSSIFVSESEPAEVTAVFNLPQDHAANAVLDEFEITKSDELVLRRIVAPSRRGATFVNDSRCTTQILNRLAYALIEVHGQDSGRSQMNPTQQRGILDAYAKSTKSVQEIQTVWRKWQDNVSQLEKAKESHSKAKRELDFLSHAIDEIIFLGLEDGEEETLAARHSELKSLIRHREDLQHALEALGANGAEGKAADALRCLQNVVSDDGGTNISQAAEAVDRAMVELNEASRCLEILRSESESDPHEIERVEERLHDLRRLARKHSVSPDQLLGLVANFEAERDKIQSELAQTDALPLQVKEYEKDYTHRAERLSKLRRVAARRLDKMVAVELPALKLKGAKFKTEISQREPGPDGHDRVDFIASTNASTPSGPIHQIASGGEFSRFMLALKVCLTSRNAGITMIFDEVDRDVGGATADAVGRRLRSLATKSQVLVVTHSPQVAAYGDHHLKIEKKSSLGATNTEVFTLSDPSKRVREIARMLSGETITEAAEAAAVALLKVT